MKLRHKKSLLKFFKNINTGLVLHGHLHENAQYIRKEIKFLNSGGSVLSSGAQNNYLNLYRINVSENEISASQDKVFYLDKQNFPKKSLPDLLYKNNTHTEKCNISLN